MAFKNNLTFPLFYNHDMEVSRVLRSDDLTALSGRIYSNPKWAYTRRRVRISWGPKFRHELDEFIRFWEIVKTRHTFRVKDYQDFNSTTPDETPSNIDQVQAVGDGVITEIQMQKTYSFQSESYSHPIYAPKQGTVLLAIDTVAITETTDYTIDYATGIITLTNPLPNGETLTAGYEYDLICRFEASEFTQRFVTPVLAEIDSFTLVEDPT